jgi:membrane associated rhomboid family serine protease
LARPRRSADLGSAFTFGGRVPSSLGFLLAAILAASIASWLTRSVAWAVLLPGLVVRGELWRLVSWAFVQGDAWGLLFGGFMLYSIGRQLAVIWTERRLVGTFLGLAAGSTLVTVLVAAAWGPANQPHLGMWPVVNGLIVMWAMIYPDQQVNIWGVLPITGRTGALLIVFGTVLYGLAGGGLPGLGAFTPHFAAIAIAYALSRGLSTRRLRAGVKDWWSEREFQRRSKHLKVVKKDGRGPSDWLN